MQLICNTEDLVVKYLRFLMHKLASAYFNKSEVLLNLGYVTANLDIYLV